jgi:site-specific recombinase XerD
MKTNQNYSLQFLIRTAKSKNGKAPIYCRINLNGKRAEISLKKYIDPSKWIPSAGIVKGSSEEARVINHQIDQLKIDINKHYNQLSSEGKPISAEKIKNSLLGIGQVEKTLLEVFKYHNDQMGQRIGIDVVKATHSKFETVLGKLELFLSKKLHRNDLFLAELNYKFITDFEHYLKVDQGIGHNTVMKYIRNLKKIMNMAVTNEWIARNPFGQFKCSSHKVNRDILSIEELSLLFEKDFAIERLSEVRDIFLFCCYTGYAFVDVEKLSLNDVSIGIDGEKWIFTKRHKTGTVSNVPLLPQAQAIIAKYAKNEYCQSTNKLLPVKSNQKMNAYLKEVADLCGITKNLTMHMARHTFATTVTLSNGVPIETVSKMLGHTKLATTQIYAQVLENKVSDDMKRLREVLTLKKQANTGT